MVKISVVVPVFNPGSNMDDLVRTLLEQSLPASEFEVVFADDGSTDGTSERLDALAAERAHFSVVHLPNSGWPGRPRNVGTDRATGEYVLYVDNDDYLAPRALERLHERARRDGADVVIGKVIGHGRRVPRSLFAEDRAGVTLDWPPLLRLLTPHKLFRRAFLAEHEIRFPEGVTRLEDNHFCMHAYFHTTRVSVLTGRPVYHWAQREDANASRTMDPVVYCTGLRDVLDLVEEHTKPGPRRDGLLVHWLRTKILARMGGAGMVARPPEATEAMWTEMRRIAIERLPARLDTLLPVNLRVRAAMLRQGTVEDLLALAAWESALQARLEVSWREPAVTVTARARLAFADGRWVPPDGLRVPAGTDLAVPDDLAADPGLFVRHKLRDTEHPVVAEHELRFEDGVPVLTARATLDPETAGDGGLPLRAGVWRAGALLSLAGFELRTFPLRDGEEPVRLRVAKRDPADPG